MEPKLGIASEGLDPDRGVALARGHPRKEFAIARRYLAFDIETARLLPEGVRDIMAHRPLGIACAAAVASDTGEPTTWHGHDADGSPAARMSAAEAGALVAELQARVAEGYTLASWNGLAFDFDVLAEESGARAACAELALAHVDMMFQVVCTKGHRLSLQKAAEGMGLPGKLSGFSGADAPRLWSEGRCDDVLAYNVQDVRVTAELALAGDRDQVLHWITRKGSRSRMALPGGWRTVTEAARLPEPDTSWMSDPPRRADLLAWTGGLAGGASA